MQTPQGLDATHGGEMFPISGIGRTPLGWALGSCKEWMIETGVVTKAGS